MSLLRNITRGLRSLLRKEKVSEELGEEIKGFLEMAAEEKMKQGQRIAMGLMPSDLIATTSFEPDIRP